MKNKELYEKTVSILVKAYQNNTLFHKFCTACAVGNIVAANNGYIVSNKPRNTCDVPWTNKLGISVWTRWDRVFMTANVEQAIYPDAYEGEAKDQIDSTGYVWEELAQIEYAFETAKKGQSEDDYMFNGLMAVVDVLDQIHENTDKVLTTEVKSRFQKV